MYGLSQPRRRAGGVRRTRGAGKTEYILIVVLIAIASIGLVGLYGNNVRELFGMSAEATAGDLSVANRGLHNRNARRSLAHISDEGYNPGGSSSGCSSVEGGSPLALLGLVLLIPLRRRKGKPSEGGSSPQ